MRPDQVPAVSHAPKETFTPSRIAGMLREGIMPRRSFFRLTTGAAIGMGLSVFGWLPPSRPNLASADCCLDEWARSCRGFYDKETICVPSGAKYDGTCNSHNWP